jgi:alanine dehydrogenase
VKVFSPNPERRERFAREMGEQHAVEVTAADSAADAADAPCVIAATNTGANGPVAIHGAWLRADAHLSTIGATAPTLREVDAETFARAAAIVVDTEHAGAECGDIMAAERAGTWDEGRVTTLARLVGDGAPLARDGLSVFKSVGTAVQDLAAAAAVARVARERGLGRELDIVSPKLF